MMYFDERFWLSVSFFILFSFVYKRSITIFKKYMLERANSISTEIDDSEALYNNARETLEYYKNKQNNIEFTVEKIIKNAEEKAAKILESANSEIEYIINSRKLNMQAKIAYYKKQIINNIENEATKLSIRAIKNMLQEDEDKKIINHLNKTSIQNLLDK